MSTFDKALRDFIAAAREDLGLQADRQSIAYLMMDGLRLLAPEDEACADAAESLADAIETAAFAMGEAAHAGT